MATAETKVQVSEFANEPFVDFSRADNRTAMEAALKKVAGELGREYPMWIAGKAVVTTAKLMSKNPSHPKQVIGVFQSASAEQLWPQKVSCDWRLRTQRSPGPPHSTSPAQGAQSGRPPRQLPEDGRHSPLLHAYPSEQAPEEEQREAQNCSPVDSAWHDPPAHCRSLEHDPQAERVTGM